MDGAGQVDLVNAIFTSIDKAAELIGKTWKVETIGDCYQVLAILDIRKGGRHLVKRGVYIDNGVCSPGPFIK